MWVSCRVLDMQLWPSLILSTDSVSLNSRANHRFTRCCIDHSEHNFSHVRYKCYPSTYLCFHGDFKRHSNRTGGCDFSVDLFNGSEAGRSCAESNCLQKACVYCNLFCRSLSSCLCTAEVGLLLYFKMIGANILFSCFMINYLFLSTGWAFSLIFSPMLLLLGSQQVQLWSLVFNNWRDYLGSLTSQTKLMSSLFLALFGDHFIKL